MRNWLWRIQQLLRGDRRSEQAEELQAHLDMEVEAGLKMGLSQPEAQRRARLRAGLVSEAAESSRDELGFAWLDGAIADFRHAFRALTRSRAFAIVAILVIAMSVAINTLIFCMFEGVVLRPLPYPSPERLVRLFDANKSVPHFAMAIGRYLDYRANAKSLESIALYTGRDMELTGEGKEAQQISGMQITQDFFAVLGRPVARGRAFADSDLFQKNRNVIISHRLWKDRFQSDPGIIGKTIRLNREPWTIVGVAAEGLQHVGGDYRSTLQGETVDLWMPLALDMEEIGIRAFHYCNAVARIRPGVTEAQAREDVTRVAALYSQRYPDFGTWTVNLQPLLKEVEGKSEQVIWLLVGAGALVMLVACANIAGLAVARAVSRRKELALRLALGASRWQLLRVGMAENLLAGIAGAAVGLGLAWAGMPLLRQLLPADFPRAHEIALTSTAALFAASIAVLTGVIAGLLPASGGTGAIESQRSTAGRDSRRLRTALVAGEVALAGLLCAGSIFLLRSYQQVTARDHGFNPSGALTFRTTLQLGENAKSEAFAQEFDQICARIKAVPGVESAGATTNLPWSGYDENTGFTILGRGESRKDSAGARYQAASPGYFEAAGMRLVEGRLLDWTRDGPKQPNTLIVNQALAKLYFPKGDAIGSVIDNGTQRQIVGVVASIRDTPADLTAKPAFWYPLTQAGFPDVFFAVRVHPGVDPASITAAVAQAVHSVDPDLPLADVRTLERRSAAALASRRFALWLFQAFAALALILAAAGIYGLLAYIVEQRGKELSIRVALGARRTDLVRLVLSDGVKMAAGGAIVCLLLIPAGGYLLRSFLYNVDAFDALTLVGAPAALLLIALLASLGPARSAMMSDPAVALRED